MMHAPPCFMDACPMKHPSLAARDLASGACLCKAELNSHLKQHTFIDLDIWI